MVDARNAAAVGRAMELSEVDVRRAGLSGAALELFCSGHSAPLSDAESLLERAVARSAASSVVPRVEAADEGTLVAVLERTAVTGYQSGDLPNWVNVRCGLMAVERWSRQMQQSGESEERKNAVAAKLRRVAAKVFCSKALRFPSAESVSARGEERRKEAEVLGGADAMEEDVPANAEFCTAMEIAQDTLRAILKRFCWPYRVESIEGDGNCYYRSVVRALTPHVPRDFEDALSLHLRKLVNDITLLHDSREMKELSEFEVVDESDRKTMAVAGVWADHVQIAKVAAFLGRRIWLLRCDDAELSMSEEGVLMPSVHYQIGPEAGEQEPPIVLYYQASPGHFETLISAQVRQLTLQEVLERATTTLLPVCDLYFRFETQQAALADMSLLHRTDFTLPIEVRQELAADVASSAETLLRQLLQFQTLLKRDFSMEAARSHRAWALFGDLAQQLRDAAEAGDKSQASFDAFGPLQQLRQRLLLHRMIVPSNSSSPLLFCGQRRTRRRMRGCCTRLVFPAGLLPLARFRFGPTLRR